MLFSPSRIRVAAAAVMMLFATQTFAAPGDSNTVFESAKIIKKKSRADRFLPKSTSRSGYVCWVYKTAPRRFSLC